MQYLERTLQVKAALLQRPDLFEEMRTIFDAHLDESNEERRPIGRGNSRWAYEVGTCEVVPGSTVVLLLKLKKERNQMEYQDASKRSNYSDWSEYGVFETYYDFVAGHINELSFRTEAGYKRYRTNILGRNVPKTFSLSENWGGTRVQQGDLGALPYFQMAVRYGEWYGQLTEGNPPLIEPKYTADDHHTHDDYTVEEGRIIDMGPSQCLLISVDRGGSMWSRTRYPNNLGVRARGEKYFKPANCLDL